MNANPDLNIERIMDWRKFADERLDVIVDPMVFRFGDIFFRGSKGSAETLPDKNIDDIWKALSSDIGSLTTFVDQLVLSERLPLIDYGITFDSALEYDTPWIARVVNEELGDHVVMTVHVQGEASRSARETALAALPNQPVVGQELEESIRRELGYFDYRWKPDLRTLRGSDDELLIPRFVYGGLVFSAFSEASRTMHVLQPKRWRLFAALSIGARSASYGHEDDLVKELDRRIHADGAMKDVHFGQLPSFLPYALSKDPQTPFQLLQIVRELRRDPDIIQYRDWRRALLRNWIEKGLVSEADQKTVKRVARRLSERFNVDRETQLEAGVGAKAAFDAEHKGIGIDAGIKVPIPVGRIWGWILEQLPGNRYIKVLTRLKITEGRYTHLNRHLNTIWSGA